MKHPNHPFLKLIVDTGKTNRRKWSSTRVCGRKNRYVYCMVPFYESVVAEAFNKLKLSTHPIRYMSYTTN